MDNYQIVGENAEGIAGVIWHMRILSLFYGVLIVSLFAYSVLATGGIYENNSSFSNLSLGSTINDTCNNSISSISLNETLQGKTYDDFGSRNTVLPINQDHISLENKKTESSPLYIENSTLDFATGTETILTPGTESSDQLQIAIYGDIVTWIDPVMGSTEVRILNLTSGREIIVPHSQPSIQRTTPSVWQDRIVFAESLDWVNHIWIYNITTALLEPLTSNREGSNQNQPAIYDNRVVYTDDVNSNSDIFLYQLETSQLSQISTGMDDTIHYSPSVTNDYVIWTGDHQGKINVYCYGIRDGSRAVIANDTADFYYRAPSVSGDKFVWQDYRNQDFDIYLYNVTSGNMTLLTPGTETTNQMHPSIWRDRVVFIEHENDSDRVILLNLTTGERSIVVNGPPDTKANPRIWDDRIVWEDSRNNEWDIYLFTLGEVRTKVASDFSVNNTLGEVPFTVRFIDKCTGNPSGYQWEFGDGNVSYEKNPVHTYRAPGSYTVSLTVNTPFSRDNKKITDLITVGAPPTASFIADPTSGPVPSVVKFTDTSAGDPVAWIWDFGDNTSSDDETPSHTFQNPGEYSVRLNVSNQFGSNVTHGSVYIVNATRNGIPVIIPGLVDFSPVTGSVVINTSQVSLYEFELTDNSTKLAIIPNEKTNKASLSLESLDGYGFLQACPFISGNLTAIVISSQDMSSTLFDGTVGQNAFTNASFEIPSYSPDYSIETVISTQIPEDEYKRLVRAVWDEQYAGGITGAAYVVRYLKHNLTETGPATITIGVGHSWLQEYSPYIDSHNRFRVRMIFENNTYTDLDTKFLYENTSEGLNYYSVSSDTLIDPGRLWALVWNSSLNIDDAHISIVSPYDTNTLIETPIILSVESGWVANNAVNEWQNIGEPVTIIRIDDSGHSEILTTKYLYYDPVKDIDVFQGYSPHGLSEFALVTVNNPGNPLQLLYLSLSSRVTPPVPPSNSNSGGGGGGGSYGGSGNQVSITT
jgi:beta propeller repeat protein